MVAQVQVDNLMGKETKSTSLAGPMLAKVSVLTRDSLSLYYCLGFKRCTVGNLRFLNMIVFHALRIPSVHLGMNNTDMDGRSQL